jgi:hypothetical protein
MTRAKLGEIAGCHGCPLDIQFQGKQHGWVDRGGNRFCAIPGRRRLHRPVRETA